ncbi:MAG: AcvB/VirJ family lysyl-phosphatidylglycerol hydrolase [Methylomonas sp.]|jgi:hypothetical protein
MKFNKKSLWYGLPVLCVALAVWAAYNPPLMHKTLQNADYGEIIVAKPLWGAKAGVLVFADAHAYPPQALGRRLAALGVTAMLVDSTAFLRRYNAESGLCLDNDHFASAIDGLLELQPGLNAERLIVSGLSQGALLPFINALTNGKANVTNLSIDFSVDLPPDLQLCPPLQSRRQERKAVMQSSPPLNGQWLSVWADQPADETAVFIRSLGNIDTRIADYDTPADVLLVRQIGALLSGDPQPALAMQVVEVPAPKPSDHVTIFYSGDGGWRDLDRTVAQGMAAQNQPVVGVDVLKTFWKHKSPEQAAADLSAAMQYYRRQWGSKTFVLAGYSFGADILPAVYNRLSAEDKNSVILLALLALGEHADFEIHVSGWVGGAAGEQAIAPELESLPKQKILCVYGREEKAETACQLLKNSAATLLELPGGHHFDEDYPKLTRLLLDVYKQHGIH